MIQFIEKHQLLYINQFGFRHGYSTTLALTDIVDKIKYYIDNKEYVIGIFLDIEKAFDSINHEILLRKLDHYGFRGHSNAFIESYLSNRKQFTEINNTRSSVTSVEYGVPQGSVLGPLLFLLFINDIEFATFEVESRLFADDTSLILHCKNINDLEILSKRALKDVNNWFSSNELFTQHREIKLYPILWKKDGYKIYRVTIR